MKFRYVVLILAVAAVLSSCSFKKLSMDANTAFMEDNDPVLVGDSLPLVLKMMDILATSNPGNTNILSSAGSLFVMYSNAYLQTPADMLPYEELEKQKEMYSRAKKLYRRGYDYVTASLDRKYKGFLDNMEKGDFDKALKKVKKRDAGDLYWGGAAILAGVSVDILDPYFASDRDKAIAMLFRACELDPDFGNGMLDEIMMQYYASMPQGMGGSMEKAEYHYRRGIELSEDNLLSIHVSYALTVCTKDQTMEGYSRFVSVLDSVISRNIENNPNNRLSNTISREKAEWLLQNKDNYFLIGF